MAKSDLFIVFTTLISASVIHGWTFKARIRRTYGKHHFTFPFSIGKSLGWLSPFGFVSGSFFHISGILMSVGAAGSDRQQ